MEPPPTARSRAHGAAALGLLIGAGLLVPVLIVAAPAEAAAVQPGPNPEIAETCGLELTLVLDASGSVSSSHAVEDVRDAGDALLTALSDTNSTARVTQFASLSEVLAQRAQVTEASMSDGGVHAEALQGYYNPIPPRPSNVNIYSYDGSGNPQSSSNHKLSNGSNQYTNWDQGLGQGDDSNTELMVFVTDGDPTGFDFDRAGDPFDAGPPPDVAVNTNRGDANAPTMDRAVDAANAIKAEGTRMLAVGVGSALNNSASRDRLVQISGPQVVRDADLGSVNSLNDIDVALVQDFEDLAQFMRGLVLQLCSPSLTIRKLSQSAEDPRYQPEQGRAITVTPTVPGGTGFRWLLPDEAAAVSKTQGTDVNGFAQFQWEPIPPEEDSTATVSEATDASHVPGRPADDDYRCELRDEFGDVRVVSGDFADPANPAFELDPIRQEIVTCTIYNSFDYQPAIALAKVNTPTEVRGDLSPPARVTSSYTVTNPGSTPLDNVEVTDDRCGPVVPVTSGGSNSGDSDGDGLLDPGESWQFTCAQPVQVTRQTAPAGRNFVNNAEVSGTDPNGERVTAADSDDVDVFTPAITLVKTVNGADQVTVAAGASVTYAYVVANAGNTPLGGVALVDDTPPCGSPTLVDDGDGDALLGVGETWTYSCTAAPDEDVVNQADVVGTPFDPLAGNTPFVGPNPVVTATDTAAVVVVNPGLSLVKSVVPDVVLLDPEPATPEPVTYTFAAENTGTAPLVRPGGTSSTAPGWVNDARCVAPPSYVSGDANTNVRLDPGETWTFTCQGSIASQTVNLAAIIGQPTDGTGTPLPTPAIRDVAQALVRVVQPDITVTKTALRPVVLDPDAAAVAGPDTPAPRVASYQYLVANPGDVPLSLVASPPNDDKCAPVTFIEGDVANPGLLDPDEVWVYDCATTLEREDADTPPGNESAEVANTVEVTGAPFFEGALVPGKAASASDDASVTVIEPGLSITKSASPTVIRAGRTVTYDIRVENTGDTALTLVGPTDEKCAPLVLQGGDTNGDGKLDGANTSPETWRFTCARAVDATPPGDTDTNTVSVTGVDPLGNSYEDSDSAAVRVIAPAIQLTKVADSVLVPAGTQVTYFFEVRNVGVSDIAAEDALEQVVLRDFAEPAVPGCRSPVLVSKTAGNQDDILERDPAEVWTYQCAAPIVDATTNIALVGGIGGVPAGLRFAVADWATAFVQAFQPGIAVVKSADPRRLEAPGKVTYTYRVTNTGDVPLAGVAARITDDTCSPLELVSGDLDADGLLDTPRSIFEDSADETWVFTCTTRVEKTTTNVVAVPASPAGPHGEPLCGPLSQSGLSKLPCDVEASDHVKVTVRPPGQGPDNGGTDPDDGGTGPSGVLPDTGAPAGLRELLAEGVLLMLLGGALIAYGRRRVTPAER